MSETSTSEAAAYVDRVAAALADVPADDRDELLDDLRAHLTEVAAELAVDPEMTLESRLGTPEEYAAELRSAAGLGPARRARPRPRERARRLWARPEVGAVVDFLPQLRPAWWVARGILIALVLARLLGLNELVGAALAVPAVLLSVRYARRSRPTRRWRTALVGVNVLALAALAGLVLVRPGVAVYDPGPGDYYPVGPVGATAVSLDGQVVNIYPYDKNGRPLHDVLLYDQDGNPISLTGGWSGGGSLQRHYPYGPDGTAITNAYPQEQSTEDDSQYPPVITRQKPPAIKPPVFGPAPSPSK
jgi:uncharacterized membrane protein